MKFGDNLKKLRKEKNITQETLASMMNVSRQSISKWETGDTYPEMNNILELCRIFNCKINDLVNDKIIDLDSLGEEIKMSVVKFKKEKQQKMKGLSKALYIISNIGYILMTVFIPIAIISSIFMIYLTKNVDVVDNELIFRGNNKIVINSSENNLELKFNNTLVGEINNQDTIIMIKEVLVNNSKIAVMVYLTLALVCLVICLLLYRKVLKNLSLLFENINCGDTPFTLENAKYIKDIAYLLIATILIPGVGGYLFEIILKTDLNVDFGFSNIIEILFLFSISYIFLYGYEIQQDSKGKIYGDVNE